MLKSAALLLFAAVAVITVPGHAHAASAIVVTADNPNGWGFLQETPTGSGTFVYGPYGPSVATPPLGGGSAQLTVDGTGGEDLVTLAFAGTRLDAITSLTYSTYRSSGSSALAPYLAFDIDTNVTDAVTSWQGRLVYEPYYSHAVSTGAWQTWNPLDNASPGNWWFTGAPGNAACPINTPCTWAAVLAAFPNAGIRAPAQSGGTLFKAGGGWTGGFVGSVDAFSIGVNNVVTTYDFELPFTVPVTTSISPISKVTSDSAFTLTVNGTNFFPSSVVKWNDSNRTTTYVSSTRLTASIPVTDLSSAGTFNITVFNTTPGGGTSNAQTFTITASSPYYTPWSDQGVGYAAPASGDAYYPSAIYDVDGFGSVNPKYKMWYSNGGGSTFLVTSTDGVSWGSPTTITGLANIHHAQVLYDAACFGTVPCDIGTSKYRMWFWDMGASPQVYSIANLAAAESADGISWTNKQAVTQNAAAKLVQSPDSGTGWNRGTYGPVNLFYQPSASNTGVEPWNYKYVMYYDGTDGGHEYTGLAYSIDGLLWSAYSGNPVLSGSLVGGTEAWDCVKAVYGTVFKDYWGYHYFYSGAGQDNGSGGCAPSANFTGIGYAFSTDGKTWTRDAGPIFNISDGVSYRSGRIYTPSVINDGSGILRMYFSVTDSSGSPKKIAYATLPTNPAPVLSSISKTSATVGDSQSTLTVNGTDFINSSIVQFGGSDKATNFVSSTQLTAVIPASDLTAVGSFNIRVSTHGPVGGLSDSQSFSVTSASSPAPASSSGGSSVPPTTVIFSGKAYPGAKITIVKKNPLSQIPIRQESVSSGDGSFLISYVGILQTEHSYGLIIEDKDGRTTPARFYSVDTVSNSLTQKDIFATPTVDLYRYAVLKGDFIKVIGYATPGNRVNVQIDNNISYETKADNAGSYQILINTATLSFSSHTIRVAQQDKASGNVSGWSSTKLFYVVSALVPEADFNGDGIIDIKDWSIFLSRWSGSPALLKTLDLNNDGKVDIGDFSVFLQAYRGQ